MYMSIHIRFHVESPLFLSHFNETYNFLDRFSKNTQTLNFIKISSVAVGGCSVRTDRHDEANSRFRNVAPKKCFLDLSSYRADNSPNYENQQQPDIKIYVGVQ
jgi:hypothetical protein